MSIISLNASNVLNALDGGGVLSILNSTLHPTYAILATDGSNALEFSGMVSVSPSGRASVTTAPVEGGSYQSINKVREPSRIQCSVVISGLSGYSGSVPDIFDLTLTSQSSTLSTIKTMLESANTYDIETPKAMYESYDLVGWSYRVTSQTGVSLLTVNLEFQEIIQQMEVQLSGAQSSDKITSNSTASGTTGVSSVTKLASGSETTLDDLSSSWSKLKTATGQLTSSVGSTVTTTFQSGLDTVSEAAASVVKSATDKSTKIVNYIASSIT